MAEEAISQELVINRLKRIEGQVRGIQKMIESGRHCESVITQLTRVRATIEGVGALVLNNYMKFCFRETEQEDSEALCSLARAIAIWGRMRVGDRER